MIREGNIQWQPIKVDKSSSTSQRDDLKKQQNEYQIDVEASKENFGSLNRSFQLIQHERSNMTILQQLKHRIWNFIKKMIQSEHFRYWVIFLVCVGLFVLSLGYRNAIFFVIQEDYSMYLSQRVKLQYPHMDQHHARLYSITNNEQIIGKKCVLINSLSIVTNTTISTVRQLLSADIATVFIVAGLHDIQGNQLINRHFSPSVQKSNGNAHTFYSKFIEFDAEYQWASNISSCSKFAYFQGSFKFNSDMISNIEQELDSQNSNLFYSSVFLLNNKIVPLLPLSSLQLNQTESSLFSQYLFVIPTDYLKIIGPANFAFYTKYNLQEIVVVPLLVIYQSIGKMTSNERLMHEANAIGMNSGKYFPVIQKQTTKQYLQLHRSSRHIVCLVSYPASPYTIQQSHAISYLESLLIQKTTIPFTIAFYVPNPTNFSLQKICDKLIEIAQSKPNVVVKLRFTNVKAVSSYAVYDSTYAYCPSKSIIVAARHNVRFSKTAVEEIAESITQKFHYYVFQHQIQQQSGSRIVSIDRTLKYGNEAGQNNWAIYQEKLMNIQVFKSDLMKTGAFWILKSEQIDFYQSEASFVLHMLQQVRLSIGKINGILAKVSPRQHTQAQLSQTRAIKTYGEYFPLHFNQLMPYYQNCLHNQVYRRNAPIKMAANIHQIWLTNLPISPIRYKLRQTLIQKNPNFKVNLWTLANLTRQNVPIVHHLLNRIQQQHKHSDTSLYAMAADLLRYQLLLQHGGIYIDFKFEGLKPLDAFLKYELIFTDCDINTIRLGRPKAVGNPVMAASKNNYHLKITLNQLIRDQHFNFYASIVFVTGGFVLRRSITQNQLFTHAGFGYHLFIPKPYEQVVNLCGRIGQEKAFDPDQEVFEVSYINVEKPIKLGIPCKQYPQSYIVNYSPLGRTWVFQKRQTN